MSDPVSVEEVVELLAMIGRGELAPVPTGLSWTDTYAGEVTYRVGEWTLVVFNDCDDWDYIDSVTAPDGRKGEFDDWNGPPQDDGWRPHTCPGDVLYHRDRALFDAAEQALRTAESSVKW